MSVDPEEPIARYLTSSGQFASTTGCLKRSALMPARDGKTSVFRVGSLTATEVLGIGRREVAELRPLYGWATVAARAVHEVGLDFEVDDTPPGHANIVGWPEDKSETIERAQDLAAKAWKLELL